MGDDQNTPAGLYLVNASGEMTPVHTEDGHDLQLLNEYLHEWGVYEQLTGVELIEDAPADDDSGDQEDSDGS